MTPLPLRADHRRKIHYVDKALQKWLLVALVCLEAGLVAGMVWLMHWRLNQVIAENLYRVHMAKSGPLLQQLLQEASVLLGIFLLANVIALLVADRLWRSHVDALLRSFMTVVGKTRVLDFSSDPDLSGRHRLLDLAEILRARERLRLAAIREQVAGLDTELSGDGDRQSLRVSLHALNKLVG